MLRILVLAIHFMVFVLSPIVTGLLSYFLRNYAFRSTHIIFQEVIATITVAFYLFGHALAPRRQLPRLTLAAEPDPVLPLTYVLHLRRPGLERRSMRLLRPRCRWLLQEAHNRGFYILDFLLALQHLGRGHALEIAPN